MENPRPSPNLGKFTSTRATRPSRSATDAGSSVGSKRTSPPCSGEGALSVAIRRPLMSVAINAFLERFDADALHHVDEALGFAVALLQIGLDEALDDVGDIGAREGRSDHFSKRSGRLIPADLDLVPLLAVLVDAEDADVPDVVVAAGVHAARDVQVELADLVQVVEVVESLLDRLRDRDRLGVGEGAEIAAGAADDVGKQADVRRRQAERARLAPQRPQVARAHVGEDQVLLVRDAQLDRKSTRLNSSH